VLAGEIYRPVLGIGIRFKHVRENGLFWSLLYRLQRRKKIKMDLVWIDSTTLSLHRLRVWGIKKQNPPLGAEERAEALKIHVGLCQGFLCGACLSASNKLDMTLFNELWARVNWDAIVHVVADKGYDCSSVTRSYQKQRKMPVIRRRGPFVPACQIESAIKHVTPSSDSLPISKT